jgi:multiple antibiotic resistance protein
MIADRGGFRDSPAMHLASIALTLFLVLDPFGNIVPIHNIMSRVPEHRRQAVLLRELLIALGILVFFLFAGSFTLSLLGIRQDALSISGGILLFLIGLGMVFPAKSVLPEEAGEEPFIVPIAVPLIAGPSAIALLLLFSSKYPGGQMMSLLAVALAWAGSTAVLMVSAKLIRLLGKRGTQALERLMGLLLVMISVQMFLDGIKPRLP